MVARVNTVSFQGVEVRSVDVQVQLSNGLPAFNIAGYVRPIILVWAFVLFAFVILTTESKAADVNLINEILGKAVQEEEQNFENLIKQLLFLTTDDIHRHGFGIKKIDMQSRQQYFTEKGWLDYQEYVLEHKGILKARSETPLNAMARFRYGLQRYDANVEGHSRFSAEGYFSYAAYEHYGLAKTFSINVLYNIKNISDVSDLLIDQWGVVIQELNKDK